MTRRTSPRKRLGDSRRRRRDAHGDGYSNEYDDDDYSSDYDDDDYGDEPFDDEFDENERDPFATSLKELGVGHGDIVYLET